MEYTDKQLANKFQRAYKAGVASNQLRGTIIAYWQDIVILCQDGKIDRETACYHIAEAMFIPIIGKDSILEDITLEAGELELPEHHISGNAKNRWEKLQQTILTLS